MIEKVRPDKTPRVLSSAPAPTRRLALFGPPPLIEGEDPAAYDDLLTRISGALKPADILEDIWVRDVVDLTWEVLRLRRLKANLMAATAYQGLRTILEPLIQEGAGYLPEEWALRIPSAVKQVERILKSAGLTADAIMAHTLTENLDQFERIERMIAMAEARRNAALRELERHRATLANTLRPTVEQIEEAEFEVVDRNRLKGAGRHD
jgi:hypothetical protein